jgi:hypothetical protein
MCARMHRAHVVIFIERLCHVRCERLPLLFSTALPLASMKAPGLVGRLLSLFAFNFVT